MAVHRRARQVVSLLIATGLLTATAWALPPRGESSIRKHCRAVSIDPRCAALRKAPAPEGLEITQDTDTDAPVPGLTVKHTVKATNTGSAALTGADLKVDLSKMLDDATYNEDAGASAGAVSYGAPVLAWKGDLAAGGAVTITYSVTVNDPDAGDHELVSAVSTETAGSSCTSSKPCVSKATVARLLDYGDAPESYDGGADGPSHEYSAKLGIGTTKSSDTADYDTAEANGDEGDDGVREFPPMSPDMTEYALDVAVTNATAGAATLAGWIDLNGDGDFDDDERALAKVAPGATSATLNWTGIHGVKGAATYVRLRLFEGLAEGLRRAGPTITVTATGFGGRGEVEDYKIVINLGGTVTPARATTPVLFVKTADLEEAKPGAPVTYTIRVVNNETTTRDLSFEDSLSDVLDDAVLDRNSIAETSGKATYNKPLLSWTGKLKPHQSATIIYTVRLKQRKGYGDGELRNSVLSADVRQNCGLDSTDERCSAVVFRATKNKPSPGGDGITPTPPTPAPPGPLPDTGAPIEQMLRLALLLVVGGTAGVLMSSVRRRRSLA